MDNDNTSYDEVSPLLDELSSSLMGEALDRLAEGVCINTLVAIQDEAGETTLLELADDGPEALLEGARRQVRRTAHAIRYAIVYEGAVGLEDDTFVDALILEFGERGHRSYSAYSLFEGRGMGDEFRWTEPAPAGEEEPLLG